MAGGCTLDKEAPQADIKGRGNLIDPNIKLPCTLAQAPLHSRRVELAISRCGHLLLGQSKRVGMAQFGFRARLESGCFDFPSLPPESPMIHHCWRVGPVRTKPTVGWTRGRDRGPQPGRTIKLPLPNITTEAKDFRGLLHSYWTPRQTCCSGPTCCQFLKASLPC